MPDNNFGQVLQVHTRFNRIIGKPSWLIVIRDVDHNQTIPYLFDIDTENNYWVIFTYSRDYLITASTLQINNYRSRYNIFGKYEINDFCGLESHGRIVRGESMYIHIDGDLTPNADTVSCHVSRFHDVP